MLYRRLFGLIVGAVVVADEQIGLWCAGSDGPQEAIDVGRLLVGGDDDHGTHEGRGYPSAPERLTPALGGFAAVHLEEGALALASAVAPVIEAVAAQTSLVEPLHQIVIAPLMLAQTVDDDHNRPHLAGDIPFHVQLCAVEG